MRALSVVKNSIQIGLSEKENAFNRLAKKPKARMASGGAGFLAQMRSSGLGFSPSLGSAFCWIGFIFSHPVVAPAVPDSPLWWQDGCNSSSLLRVKKGGPHTFCEGAR